MTRAVVSLLVSPGLSQAIAAKLFGKTCRLDKITNHVTLSRQLDALGQVCSVSEHLMAHAMQTMEENQATWAARVFSLVEIFGNLRSSKIQVWLTVPTIAHLQLRGFESQEMALNPAFGGAKSLVCRYTHGWFQAEVKTLLLCGDSPYAGKEAELAAGKVSFSLTPDHPWLLEANASQRQALLSACRRQLTLIQGPPGTGRARCRKAQEGTVAMKRMKPVQSCSCCICSPTRNLLFPHVSPSLAQVRPPLPCCWCVPGFAPRSARCCVQQIAT